MPLLLLVITGTESNVDILHVTGVWCDCPAGLCCNIQWPQAWP